MKKLIILVSALALISCKKSEEAHDSTGIGDLVKGAQSLNNLSSSMDDIQKQTDKLKKTTPISNAELKAVIPESILGLKKTESSVGDVSAMGLVSASATYTNDANKKIEISIMDGAGETGSAMISLLMMGLKAESEKTTPEGFEKTTEINNVRAMVSQHTYQGSETTSDIQYIAKDRYLVKIDGEGFTIDELKPIMKMINTSSLK